MFLFYFVIITNVNTFSLFETSFLTNDFIDSQGWTFTQNHGSQFQTDCGGSRLFGGHNLFGNRTVIGKFYQLPPHSTIKLQYKFWKIDNWTTDDFYSLIIDGIIILDKSYLSSEGTQLCGNTNYNDVISTVEVIHQHHFDTLQINIVKRTLFIDLLTQGYWGIRDVYLYIKPCPAGCLFCDESDSREQCIKWTLIRSSLTEIQTELFINDGWSVENSLQTTSNCSNIPLLCGYNVCANNKTIKNELNLPPHHLLKIQFKYYAIDSWDGNERATLTIDNKQQWDKNFASNTSYRYNSFCGHERFMDYQHNIEFSISHSKQDIQFIFSNNLDQPANDESFGIRDFKIFTLCQFGESANQQCSQFCGDSIVQFTEECDDGNIYPFDGCHNCQYSCIEGCSNCIKGICYDCINPKVYEIDNTCQYAECEYCDECILGYCLKCQETYKLIENKCYPICDGEIIAVQNYNCDDENLIFKDNCYECQNQCNVDCKDCQNGVCKDICKYGEYLINNQCETICGDLIVAQSEQCDDGNNIKFDGCFGCQYSCINNCFDCYQGICIQCENNFYYDQLNNLCISICGDGLLALQTEQCDDSNSVSNDGCSSNCRIEKDWICRDSGECIYSQYPIFEANYIKSKTQYQFVSIKFSQPVRRLYDYSINYQDTINVSLINLEFIKQNITIIPITPASRDLQIVEYMIQIQIDEALNTTPYLQIQLIEQLENEYNYTIVNLIQRVQLQQPNFLSENEKQIVNNINEYSEKQVLSLGVLGCLLLLSGNSMALWVTLEILQELSYLKYINVQFPENLLMFFDSFELISFKPIYQFFEMSFKNLPIFYNYSYFTAQQKLEYYSVNANFIYNARSLILNILMLILSYCFVHLFDQSMNNLQKRQYCDKNHFISKCILLIKFRSIKMKYQIKKYGIERLFYANSWDLFFMIFLQFHAKKLQKMFINKMAAFIIFILSFYFILGKFQSKFKYQKLKTYQYNKDNIMLILKKLWFMQILISYQQEEVLQVLLLSVINSIYLMYLITKKNICYQEIFLQLIVLMQILSASIYWKESIINFSYESKVLVGWVQITLMVFVILFISIIDLCASVKSIIKFKNLKNGTQTIQTELNLNRPTKFIICNQE